MLSSLRVESAAWVLLSQAAALFSSSTARKSAINMSLLVKCNFTIAYKLFLRFHTTL